MVLGKVKGFSNHDAGYDLESEEKKIIAEVKNKHNTMNASNTKKVISDLEIVLRTKPGYTGYLIYIIPSKPERYRKKIGDKNVNLFNVDGASFYTLATGYQNALEELYSALANKLCSHSPGVAQYIQNLYRQGFGN